MSTARLRRHVPNAAPEALAILDPSRGAIEPPIRAEIFAAARFRQHGRSLGEAHAARSRTSRSAFFPRLHDNIAVLREAHRYIGSQERSGRYVSPAGEWLLDNFHVVVAQIKEIHDGLPRRYFRDLPVLVDAHLAGLPRIYGVAWAYVAHTDSAFDEALLVDFLSAYQETRELTLGELWALPTALRVVLIENLRRLSERVAATKAARELGNLWCDRLEGRADSDPAIVFDTANARGVMRPFALQIMQRMQSDAAQYDDDAIRCALAAALPDLAEARVQQQAEESADNLSVSNAITSLRLLGDTQWRDLIGRTSALMQLMQTSPTFCAERDDTQDATLHALERLARRSRTGEVAVARTLLDLMCPPTAPCAASPAAPIESPTYWLRGPGRRTLYRSIGLGAAVIPQWTAVRRRVAMPAYLATVVLGSIALTGWFVMRYAAPDASPIWVALLLLLALGPASETVIAVVNRLISESVPPRRLPRLALAGGIPREHRVLVVIPAIITDVASVRALARNLEHHYLANRERHAQFALLTDFADASSANCDSDAALLTDATAAIDALESRYPSAPDAPRRFLLLHRQRSWSETEQKWIGWERKRGKLEQLINLLAEQRGNAFIDLAARSQPAAQTAYVLTLDSDTELPPGALRDLVGIAAHPMNSPQVDVARRRVVAGYGILQPRIATPLPVPEQVTPFHWLFAGQCGIDPYSVTTSEVYQDLFEEGTFTGKGLLHVNALHRVLSGRLPDGQVLSHDLIEGSIARCGGVSDVTLIEDAPLHVDVADSRVHRWTRGDWQLLPLLLRVNKFPLRAINRWKIIDNLRRSLVAPLSVGLMLVGLALGKIAPTAALALICAAFGAGALLGAIAGLAPSRDDLALLHFYRQAFADVGRAVGSLLWNVVVLLQHALLLTNAIVTALYRTCISRRGLLEWTTAAVAHASARHHLAGLARRHLPVSLIAMALLAALLWNGTAWPRLSIAACLVWAAAPLWIWWASRPRRTQHETRLTDADREYLLGVARDSWRLFERYVGPDSHHLPPDNVQTVPHTMIAQRTSPTNIGLYLLTVACARQFGWIDTEEMLTRCERTLTTLSELPRHHGHFLNWYDTASLAPLKPSYVSTVDSGNLCGHLIALAGACDERLTTKSAANSAAGTDTDSKARLQTLAANCRRLAFEPDFGFLYDQRRRLFHIGYRVAEQQLDKSFYDLLASESRLASFWAIAKGDVPVSHWSALGRPFFAVGTDAGLRSWSGSMFEYLMPYLVLDERRGGALASASLTALHEQVRFASAQKLPWGISECANATNDDTLAYQYAPQGVPRLALRRTPADELVVAPYATALAAMLAPSAAVNNLHALTDLQARDEMGFVEALDFTAERQTANSACTLVSTFMAHHHGMTIVALANVLLTGAPRRWAMRDPRLSAVASLLQQRVPREVLRLEPPPVPSRGDRRKQVHGSTYTVIPGRGALQPTQLLSNGHYSVALRANGAGWSRFGAADISRWRDDALRDAYGTFLYLRRPRSMAPVSITQHPAPDPGAVYETVFCSDRVQLDARWFELRTRCTVWVSPEDDVELRRIELYNDSSQTVQLELMSMFEVSLAEARADETHPAFSNVFVCADWDAHEQALYLARKPRLVTEAGLHAVHFIAHADEHVSDVRVQTDRARWLGRNRDAAHPLARYDAPTAGDAARRATGLDPLASLSMQLTVPAHGVAHVTLATAAAIERAALEDLVERYRQPSIIDRSSLMSATLVSIRLREMRVRADDLVAIQTLTTTLALVLARPTSSDSDTLCDRQLLWRFGISGDRPIVVVSLSDSQGLRLVRSLAQALRLWSWGGLTCDLVIIDAEPKSYHMPVQLDLATLRDRYARDALTADPARLCGLYVIHADELSVVERATLYALARLQLDADGRPLSHHVRELVEWHDEALASRLEQADAPLRAPGWTSVGPALQGEFDGSRGGFRFRVSGPLRPARPWINVLANPLFGTQISEAGTGYTWAGNSQLHQLTAWSNDPVIDSNSEAFFAQDLRTREIWNLGAGSGSAEATYSVVHEQGSTTIAHRRGDVEISATWCVDTAQSLKHVRVELHNVGSRSQRLRLVGIFEWVMGTRRSDRGSVRTALASLTSPHDRSMQIDALLATQRDNDAGFGGSTAFVVARFKDSRDATLDDWTCDRRELFDNAGGRVIPDQLGKCAGVGLDPCAAVSVTVTLVPGQTRECAFLLGHGDTRAAACALAATSVADPPSQREQAARVHWDALLGAVTVRSPDPLFDVLVNRWLLYQTVACRLWARAGFYQAGGAFGYRDQLQDAMALAITSPNLLRNQLLLAASRQFVEGDVQHWWHPPTGAGVRTRSSDDLLWLPYATAHYIEVTGDASVLDETAPFLDGEPIPVGAEDAYFVPHVSPQSATLYEHCARALDRSLTVGAHGLPLIGSGDWNDGMNRVGLQGRGESVWLGWFLCSLANDWTPIARTRDDSRADRWDAAARGWRAALSSAAWDGEWFLRAFFDDGSPIGSHVNAECRVDLVAQTWAVLSGAVAPSQQRTAMASAMRLLVDDAAGLIRMLDPPFATATPNAGYIQAYPPGVRENGGQYSHAGVWAVMAQASIGDADAAYRTFTRLSPAHRSTNPTQATAYQLEPYVMAGDIYTHAPYVGRGGWSWYTGSAAWMHRAAIESICGLRVRGGSINVAPRLPTHWPSITITLRREGRTHELIVCAPWASTEIARATTRGAVELHVGESLVLADAGESSCHLVVATDTEAEQPVAVSMSTTDGQHGDVPLSA